jgi:hypothetical protein
VPVVASERSAVTKQLIGGRPKSSVALALALALGIGDLPLRAQQPAPPEQTAGWIFTPSFGIGGSWDDNVLLAGEVNPGDYGTPFTPSLSLDYGGRRTRLSTAYEGTLVMYRNFDELNSTQQRFRGFVQRRATRRLTLFAQETYNSSPTTDILDLSGVPFFRIGSRTNVAGGGLDAALSKTTTMRAMYTLRTVDFEDRPSPIVAEQLQGGYAHEILANVGRALSTRLTLGGEYQLRRSVLSDGADRFNMHTAAATVQYVLSPMVTLSGAFGVARLDEGLSHDARTGPSVQAAITKRGSLGTASASYQRTFIPSFGFGGTFQNEEWAGSVRVPFARNRAYAFGSVVFQNNDPLELDQPSLKSLLFSSVVGYQMTRWLSLEGYYHRTQQDERRVSGDVVRNQAGFRVVASKPMKLH